MSRSTFVPLRDLPTLRGQCMASRKYHKEECGYLFYLNHKSRCYLHPTAPYRLYLEPYTSIGSYPLVYIARTSTQYFYQFHAACALQQFRESPKEYTWEVDSLPAESKDCCEGCGEPLQDAHTKPL